MKFRSIVVLLITLSLTSGYGQTLHLSLKKGDQYRTVTETSQTVIQKMGGQETSSLNSTRMTLDFTVLEQRPETRILMKITQVRSEQTSPAGTLVFDSSAMETETNPQAAQMARIFSTLMSHPLTLILDPETGQQIRIDGWQGYIDAVISEMGIQDEKQRTVLSERLKESAEDQIINNGMQGMFPPVFGRTLTIGSSWTTSDRVNLISDMKLDTTYTVEAMTNDTIRLRMQSTMATPPDAQPVDMGIMRVQYELNGSQSGTLVIDRKSGWVLESAMDHNLTGTVTPDGQGFSVPLEVSGRTMQSSARQ